MSWSNKDEILKAVFSFIAKLCIRFLSYEQIFFYHNSSVVVYRWTLRVWQFNIIRKSCLYGMKIVCVRCFKFRQSYRECFIYFSVNGECLIFTWIAFMGPRWIIFFVDKVGWKFLPLRINFVRFLDNRKCRLYFKFRHNM